MDWARTEEHKKDTWAEADFAKIERIFYKALSTNDQSKDILVEMLRHHVPIHCGGMSDPFQRREQEMGLTKRFIQLSNSYNYPVQFSTKATGLPDGYLDILNPKIHAFQISLMGWDQEYIRKWEANTPTAKARIAFANELKNRGFWVSIRIQPVIEIEQAEKLCQNLPSWIDYVTIEHFKSIYDVHSTTNAFFDKVSNKEDYVSEAGKIQVRRDIKIRNIKRLMKILDEKGIPVGVGDNDLHYMSQSRCCCGIDTAGEAFKDYMKYNLTYMATGSVDKDTFIPKMNPRKHINDQKYGLQIDCKQYVEDYINAHPDYLGPRRAEVEKELFGRTKKSLF